MLSFARWFGVVFYLAWGRTMSLRGLLLVFVLGSTTAFFQGCAGGESGSGPTLKVAEDALEEPLADGSDKGDAAAAQHD